MLKEELITTLDQIIFLDKIETSSLNVPADSNLTIVVFLSKGWDEKQILTFNFDSPNSSLTFIALNIGRDNNQFPFETVSNHRAANTKALYKINSVLFDQSKVAYRGNLIIPKAGQGAEVYLSHNTLLLSDKAKADTEPCLEIEANEVSAGHAATVGTVDDDMLFYIKSRGLNQEEGKKLLVQGFLEDPLSLIHSEETRNKLQEMISNHLN